MLEVHPIMFFAYLFFDNNFFLVHLYFFFEGITLALVLDYGLVLIYSLFILFIHDVLSYALGGIIGFLPIIKKLDPKNKKLFYIYFKCIPFLGSISVFLGSILLDKNNVKEDVIFMWIGNFIFLIFTFIFFSGYAHYTGYWNTSF